MTMSMEAEIISKGFYC